MCCGAQFRLWYLEMISFLSATFFSSLKFISPQQAVLGTLYLETTWNRTCFFLRGYPYCFPSQVLGLLWVHVWLYFFPLQLNVVNSVSISEDIKPLPGLPGIGNMNYPSTSPSSLVKHICAICGDRSSGTCRSRGYSQGSRPGRVPEVVPVPSLTWPLVPSGRERAF